MCYHHDKTRVKREFAASFFFFAPSYLLASLVFKLNGGNLREAVLGLISLCSFGAGGAFLVAALIRTLGR